MVVKASYTSQISSECLVKCDTLLACWEHNPPVPVFLTHEKVKRILCTEEIIIVQNLYRTHPVGVEVSRNLKRNEKKKDNYVLKTDTDPSRETLSTFYIKSGRKETKRQREWERFTEINRGRSTERERIKKIYISHLTSSKFPSMGLYASNSTDLIRSPTRMKSPLVFRYRAMMLL